MPHSGTDYFEAYRLDICDIKQFLSIIEIQYLLKEWMLSFKNEKWTLTQETFLNSELVSNPKSLDAWVLYRSCLLCAHQPVHKKVLLKYFYLIWYKHYVNGHAAQIISNGRPQL